ncbi:hypothetical protein F5Y19DRAFT_185331 [Xylariaceae sp. FL1651]|nr:hypothetical protein F5Y19DRAFT_185331 [Xylariaceae sp. FL1651]
MYGSIVENDTRPGFTLVLLILTRALAWAISPAVLHNEFATRYLLVLSGCIIWGSMSCKYFSPARNFAADDRIDNINVTHQFAYRRAQSG